MESLLDKINMEIYDNGGRYRLAHLIAEENPLLFTVPERLFLERRSLMTNRVHKKWTKEEENILWQNYSAKNVPRLSIQLGRTQEALRNKHSVLKKLIL